MREDCLHRVLRIKRTVDEHEFIETMYVCGSCSLIFEVKPYEEQKRSASRPEPMLDSRKPWGTRLRQA
jgi:hypothetical protein